LNANSNRIGDLVVAFGGGLPKAGRDASLAWKVMEENRDWRLWQQLSTSSWKGFPLMRCQIAGWHITLLGELYQQPGALEEIVRGDRDAAELNGHFLLWAWDENRRQWHVWTDRFGTLHAYHAHHPGVAALGTCSSTVAQLASRRRLDNHSLAGFFGFGFSLRIGLFLTMCAFCGLPRDTCSMPQGRKSRRRDIGIGDMSRN